MILGLVPAMTKYSGKGTEGLLLPPRLLMMLASLVLMLAKQQHQLLVLPLHKGVAAHQRECGGRTSLR